MKPKAIIVDIDGTLANYDHRRHFVDPKLNEEYLSCPYQWDDPDCGVEYRHKITHKLYKPDWKSFNEQMVHDTPNSFCLELLNKMCPMPKDLTKPAPPDEVICIFVTGREWTYADITVTQVRLWLPNLGHNFIYMRKEKDYRADTVIKKEIYETDIKDKYDVLFCIDDRKSVVDLWRSLGLVCLQCAKGDF